jgi:CARDB/PKD domain/Fibronectin type III domain
MFSLLSSYFRSFLLRVFLVLPCTLLTLSVAHAAEVKLAWDPNTEADLAGYRLYYGFESRKYDRVTSVGNCTSTAVTGLEDGRTYHFAVTAVNSANLESDFSNEVSVTLPAVSEPPPTDGNTGQDSGDGETGTSGGTDPTDSGEETPTDGTSGDTSNTDGDSSSGTGTTPSPTNTSPLANAGPDQKVNEGDAVILSGANSTDPEGGILAYTWSQVSGTPVTLDNLSAARATFTSPSVGPDGETLVFQLTLTDPGGLQSSDTCLVNVLDINQPPTVNAGPDQSVAEYSIVTLDGSVSADPDGFALDYEWVQAGGSPVVLSDPFAARPTFAAPNVGSDGETLTFQLTVTDSGGLQARDSCIVNVTWLNQPPAANAGQDQSVMQTVTVTLDGTGSTDPDGGPLAYYWLQTEGSPVTLDNPHSAQPRFVADTPGDGGNLVFSLTVTDQGNLSASDQCSVLVNGAVADIDLAGQWRSLKRSVKKSFNMVNGSIRVKNLGTSEAPGSVIHFYKSLDSVFDNTDLYVGKTTVSSIPAGSYVDVNVNLKYTSTVHHSAVYVIGLLDASGAIVEIDEANNAVVSGLLK